MAEFIPLKGCRYTKKAGEINTLVCPPYDIIHPQMQAELLHQNPFNFVNLELPTGKTPYQTANHLLYQWAKEGILQQDHPSYYVYEQQFSYQGNVYHLTGVIGRTKLERFSSEVVIPHENTLSKAKEDRFLLLKETGCQFSPVICLYEDKQLRSETIVKRAQEGEPIVCYTDWVGTRHTVWQIKNAGSQSEIQDLLADKKLYIADGHHRYETALRYQKESGTKNADYTMMLLYPMQSPALIVLATHRGVKGLPSFCASAFLKKSKVYFEVTHYSDWKKVKSIMEQTPASFAFLSRKGNALLTLKKDVNTTQLTKQSDAFCQLDVVILQELVLRRLLGIDDKSMAMQKNLCYTREAQEANDWVENGECDCAFLLRPTRVEQILEVAAHGEKLPQKSTYFYPKPLSGFVFYQINGKF